MNEQQEAPQIDKLAAALVAFQKVVPVIEKKQTADIQTKSGGSYSYKYADLADIWAAIRNPLADNGLAVTQHLVGGSDGYTGIKTSIIHLSGQTSTETLEVPTEGKTPQEAGSVFTYYKRYALGAALGISTEEDDDAQSGNTPPAPRASTKNPASEKQRGLIKGLSRRKGKDDEWIEATLSKVHTSADASAVIDKLNALADGEDQPTERDWK